LTSNIRWAANDIDLYQSGFERYNVSQDTGFSDETLVNITKGLVSYFNSGEIDDTMAIFNQDELAHLRDVKNLIELSYIIQWVTLGYMVIFTIVGFVFKRRQFFHTCGIAFSAGSIAGIIGVSLVGIAALINFDSLFRYFHRIFFRNDFWISSGYLPRIFTEGFFYDVSKFIAVATVSEAMLIVLVAGFLILRRRFTMN